jgi:A nuclease of the HNH/ENDO VII superfamily with conserved WHH
MHQSHNLIASVGEQLKQVNKEYDIELAKAESDLGSLVKSKEWQLARSAVDVAGIVDPTPISDGIGAIMSLAEGDFIGAGLSAVSFIPYLGDALGKTAKGTRAAKKLKELTGAIAKITKRLDQLKDKFVRRKEAAKRVREARRKAIGSIEECARQGRWGSQLPTTGTWKPANSKGHGVWTSDNGKYSVEYKEGWPDFSTAKGPPGAEVYRGKVEIEMTGNNSKDFSAADKEWKRIHDEARPDGYTWHHKDDGVTMELVRRDVHDKAMSGAAHTGGASIVDPAKKEF